MTRMIVMPGGFVMPGVIVVPGGLGMPGGFVMPGVFGILGMCVTSGRDVVSTVLAPAMSATAVGALRTAGVVVLPMIVFTRGHHDAAFGWMMMPNYGVRLRDDQ